MDTIFLAVLVAAGITTGLSGYAGWVLARRRGVNPWAGAVPGVILPWIGLVVPAAMRPAGSVPALAKPDGARRLVCVGLVGAGLAGILLSAFNEWATVSGSVNAVGEEFAERVSGGPGDTVVGLGFLLLTVGVSVALLVGHVLHGGLRFSLVGLCIAATFASVTFFGVIASDVASDVSSFAARWSAGHAEAQVELGLGAIAAATGASLLCAGWLVAMSGRQVTVTARIPAADPWSAPAVTPRDPWSAPPAVTSDPWASTSTSATTPAPWSPPPTSSGQQPPAAPMPGQPPAGW